MILFVGAYSCGKKRVELIYMDEARVIQMLENGNWEVTPEYIALFRMYEKFYEANQKDSSSGTTDEYTR